MHELSLFGIPVPPRFGVLTTGIYVEASAIRTKGS
jgi:hypothetical protein